MKSMNMNRIQRLLTAFVIVFGLLALGESAIAQGKGHGKAAGQGSAQGPGKGAGKAHKQNHHDAKQMLGDKIKTNGSHVLHKKGDYTATVDVQNGKVAGVHVKHAKKGDIPVTKYKTNKKMAQGAHLVSASLRLVQGDQYLGTMWIGYAYIDEWGEEEIYWFPYDMVLDGDTGAIEYVPAY